MREKGESSSLTSEHLFEGNSLRPQVSIVAVTHNRKNKIVRLLNSLESNSAQDSLEIIVVDDASADGTDGKVSLMFPNVRRLRVTDEVFLAKARNIGAHHSKARYILFVDDDVIIESSSIKRIAAFMESHSEYGIAGPVITYSKRKDEIWHTGVHYERNSFAENEYVSSHRRLSDINHEGFIDCSYLPSIFMVRSEVFRELNGFDSTNFPFSYEDLDLALRAKSMGYKTACVLSALASHDLDESSVERVIQPARAFHHGRSRTRFYVKYVRWKLLWLPIYFLGFVFMQSSSANGSFLKRLQIAVSYLKGIICGIAGK